MIKSNRKEEKTYLFFYVMAIVFLVLVPYTAYVSYGQIAESASSYGVDIMQVMDKIIFTMITTSGPYLAFSCIMYGFGVTFKKNM